MLGAFDISPLGENKRNALHLQAQILQIDEENGRIAAKSEQSEGFLAKLPPSPDRTGEIGISLVSRFRAFFRF
jgi:hypothetical protein